MEIRLISQMFLSFFALSVIAVIAIVGISFLQSPGQNVQSDSASMEGDPNYSSSVVGDPDHSSIEMVESPPAAEPTPLPTTQPPAQAVLGDTTTSEQDEFAERLYALINGFRREQELSPLTVQSSLEVSAGAKVYDMQQRKYWTHQDPEGNPPWRFFTTAGYDYLYAGENISTNHNSPWAVFSQWEQSPSHRQEMLKNEYADMGLGIDCQYQTGSSTSCVVVLHLGKRR